MVEICREHSMKTIQSKSCFPPNLSAEVSKRRPLGAAPDERATWQPTLPTTFLIFCLQLLGRLFTLAKNYRACAKKNLSGALNQNKKT